MGMVEVVVVAGEAGMVVDGEGQDRGNVAESDGANVVQTDVRA